MNPINLHGASPYKPSQIMDGQVLVGTIERETTGGFTAVLEATGETRWFPHKSTARTWIETERSAMALSDRLESVRSEWGGYDDY